MSSSTQKLRSHVFKNINREDVKHYKMMLNDTEASRKLFLELNDNKVVGVAKNFMEKEPIALEEAGGDTDIVIQNLGGRPDYDVDYGTGPRINGVHLNVIFWGSVWLDNPPANPSAGDILNDISTILASPYLYGCIQYGAGFYDNVLAGAWINDRDFPPRFTLVDANYEAWLMMTSGPVHATSNTIVCIILPPDANIVVDYKGQHGYSVQPDLQRIPVMWIRYRARDGMSGTFSHELVEVVTDPFWDGIKITNTDWAENEIADVCPVHGILNGVTVQAYWSDNDKACIVPQPTPVTAWQIMAIEKHWGPHSNPNTHITGAGGVRIPSQQKFWMSQLEIIMRIDKGDKFFVKGPDGSQAEVKVYVHFPPWNPKGTRYIATVPDDSELDNLLALPDSNQFNWMVRNPFGL